MIDADYLDDARNFVPPDQWPRDLAGCRALLYRLARIWGTRTALGEMTIDESYELCRASSESVQVSTSGIGRWKCEMQFATWVVDQAVTRIGDAVAVSDGRALRDLSKVGVVAISAGADDRSLRDALADAAERINIQPPVELLHEAYHQAIAQSRRNARWMASRATI